MELTRNGNGPDPYRPVPDKSGRPAAPYPYGQAGPPVGAVRKAQWLGLVRYCVFGLALASLLIVAGCGKNGDDESAVNKDERSLHEAVERGDLADVKRHLQRGADVNAKDEGGRTPLHWAAYGANKDVVECLINSGAAVNARDEIDWTPLHLAAWGGGKDVAELLIDKGADVSVKNKNGLTPLHEAEGNGHTETAELLKRHGAE